MIWTLLYSIFNFFLAIWKKQVWSDSDGLCKSQEKRKEQEVLPPLMKVWKYESMLLGNERQDVILNSPPSWADSAATQRPWRNIADKKKKKKHNFKLLLISISLGNVWSYKQINPGSRHLIKSTTGSKMCFPNENPVFLALTPIS